VCYHSILLLADEEDIREVSSAVATLVVRWKDLGISLGLRLSALDVISTFSHTSGCLREMLVLWLRQSYNVRTTLIFHPLCLI